MPARPKPVSERKIYFYRANAGVDQAGRPIAFDPTPALTHITRLPFTAQGRYLDIGDGNAICCWPQGGQAPRRLRLGTIRRTGLPQLDHAGQLQPLPIPATSGLAEQIHVEFFPDNVVGSEFNFYGPRLSRLSEYLERKAQGLCRPVVFEPLLRQDVLEQLRRLRDVRLFHFKVRASFVETIRRADRSLAETLDAAIAAGHPYDVELVLRAQPRTAGALGEGVLDLVRRLARLPELHGEVTRFTVKGFDAESGGVETIDVLKDQLIASKRIVRINERSRALDSGSAFEAIAEAYRDLRVQLEAAASAGG